MPFHSRAEGEIKNSSPVGGDQTRYSWDTSPQALGVKSPWPTSQSCQLTRENQDDHSNHSGSKVCWEHIRYGQRFGGPHKDRRTKYSACFCWEKILGTEIALRSFVPEFQLKEYQVEAIFLVDCSGSMDGISMDLAKESLQVFIHSLPLNSFFNIFLFGTTYESMFPRSKKYDDDSL